MGIIPFCVHGKDNTHLERRPFEILTSRLAHLSIHSFLHSLLDSTSVKSLTFWNWNFVYSRQWPRGAFLLGSEEKSRQHISTNWHRRNPAYLHNDQPIHTCVHPNGPSGGRCPIRIQNDLESTRSHRRRSHLHVDWDNLRRPSIRDSRSEQPTCRQRRLVYALSLALLHRLHSRLICLRRLGRRVREGRCAGLVGAGGDQGRLRHRDLLLLQPFLRQGLYPDALPPTGGQLTHVPLLGRHRDPRHHRRPIRVHRCRGGTQCIPMSTYWDPTVEGTCININDFFYSTNIFTIITDIMIIGLPIATLWKLNCPRAQKYGIMLAFLLGGISTIASCIR